MERKKALNKDKDMSTFYERLGIYVPSSSKTVDLNYEKALHYWKIQRNLYRHHRSMDYAAEAASACLLAAKDGLPEAMCDYGQDCLIKGNVDEGKEWLEKAANQGLGQAMFYLGEHYRHKKESALALSWYEKAAHQGHGESMFQAGYLMICQANLPFHLEKVEFYMRTAREKGSIGLYLFALSWYRRHNNPDANTLESECLAKIFQELDENPSTAFYQLGVGYLGGLFSQEENPEELGLEYLRQAGGLNHKDAQLILSEIFLLGEWKSCKLPEFIHLEEGRKWLSLAMKQQHPESYVLFAKVCKQGKIEPKSPEELEQLFQLSMDRGSPVGMYFLLKKKPLSEQKDVVLEFFQEERPTLYWLLFYEFLESPQERITFLQQILQRVPYFPFPNGNQELLCLHGLLAENHLLLGNAEQALSHITEGFAQKKSDVCRNHLAFAMGSVGGNLISGPYLLGEYYLLLGEKQKALVAFEEDLEEELWTLRKTSDKLAMLYGETETISKIIQHFSWYISSKDIPLKQKVYALVLPLLTANPETVCGKKTYHEIHKELIQDALQHISHFSTLIRQELAPYQGEDLLKKIKLLLIANWSKEAHPFLFSLLEEDNSLPALLYLGFSYHPLTNLKLIPPSKIPCDHEKARDFLHCFFQQWQGEELSIMYDFCDIMSFYAGLCYLEKEPTIHLEQAKQFCEISAPDLSFWFQQGFYGRSKLYSTDAYGNLDPEMEEDLLEQGIEVGEYFCLLRLAQRREAELDLEEASILRKQLWEQEEDPYSSQLAWVRLIEKALSTEFLSDNPWCGTEELEEMFSLLTELASEEEGYRYEATTLLAKFYRQGFHCAQDFVLSQQCLEERLAKEPEPQAETALSAVTKYLYYDLGLLALRLDNPERNLGKAKYYFEQSKEKFSYHFLAQIYEGEENFPQAITYSEIVVKSRGDGYVDALLRLGSYYEKGVVVPQNFNKAKEYYEKAVTQGSKKAKERLKRWE